MDFYIAVITLVTAVITLVTSLLDLMSNDRDGY